MNLFFISINKYKHTYDGGSVEILLIFYYSASVTVQLRIWNNIIDCLEAMSPRPT